MDNKLGLQDLASAFAERYGMDAKSSAAFVKTVFEIVEEYVAKDKLVKIKGFGTFKLINVSDRESVNVNTGERIVIAGHSKLTFTPDSALKDAVNRPFADFETTPLNEATPIEAMERMPEEGGDDVNEDDSDSGALPASSSLSEAVDTKEALAGSITALARDMVKEDGRTDEGNVPDENDGVDMPSSGDAADERSVGNDSTSDKDANPSYPMAAEVSEETDCCTGKSCCRWPYVLFTLLLMALSYICGCYRVHDMIDIALYSDDTPEAGNVKPALSGDGEDKRILGADSIACDTIGRDTLSGAAGIVSGEESVAQEETPEEMAKHFPQVPNGEYWIVGDAGRVHTMQVGETLYKITAKELGDRDLIQYLIVFNRFANPNIIHKGDTIRIPILIKKQGTTVSGNDDAGQ